MHSKPLTSRVSAPPTMLSPRPDLPFWISMMVSFPGRMGHLAGSVSTGSTGFSSGSWMEGGAGAAAGGAAVATAGTGAGAAVRSEEDTGSAVTGIGGR